MPREDWVEPFLRRARVARLASVDEQGQPHAVPIVLAYDGQRIFTPIDEKPKRAGPYRLQRARNIQANPSVVVLVDVYAENWKQLAWVQVRGRAEIVEGGPLHASGVELLQAKYPQYDSMPLHDRPIIIVTPTRSVSWRADPTRPPSPQDSSRIDLI